MSTEAERVRALVVRARPLLAAIPPAEAARPRHPGAWSKQEILGHLLDSALHNQQRFVRAQIDPEVAVPGYESAEWVRVQDYAHADWPALVELWAAYNLQLARVVERIPAARQSVRCWIGDNEPVTLQQLVESYVEHLLHHLQQIVPEIES